ncbi:MAG: membrane dipeptidase [Chitinophagales bacterium]|nr:membrane dipeptidase [Chitinophagales bacterium]
MSSGKYFADIHIHPTLKSFNSGRPYPRKNIWDSYSHDIGKTNPAKFVMSNTEGLAKYTQTNFYNLSEGKLRVATASLYPMEKGFMNMRNLPNLIVNKKAQDEVLQILSGYTVDSIKYMRESQNYFGDLLDEYRYLKEGQGKSPDGQSAYKIVNNYAELKNVLEKDETTLAVIVAIEGSHVLFDEEMLTTKLTTAQMKRKLEEHIGIIKSWETPPLTVNLSHHFYNQLCGHSRSFAGGSRNLLNQNKGIDTGLTGLGIKVLKEYASVNNGKRIIVDTKHMSVKGRIEYYNWIKSYNYISPNDKIPVISSHTGVNGFKTMTGSVRTPDSPAKYESKHFNSWSLNISDEEINLIHNSTGLIGIMLDKHKLGGGEFFKNHINGVTDKDKIKEANLRVFFDNALQIVKAVGNETGWNSIAIGSDLDGAIEHIEPYDQCSTYPQLYQDMVSFLERTRYGKTLWYQQSPEEIVDKIMRKNAMDFYERHFV